MSSSEESDFGEVDIVKAAVNRSRFDPGRADNGLFENPFYSPQDEETETSETCDSNDFQGQGFIDLTDIGLSSGIKIPQGAIPEAEALDEPPVYNPVSPSSSYLTGVIQRSGDKGGRVSKQKLQKGIEPGPLLEKSGHKSLNSVSSFFLKSGTSSSIGRTSANSAGVKRRTTDKKQRTIDAMFQPSITLRASSQSCSTASTTSNQQEIDKDSEISSSEKDVNAGSRREREHSSESDDDVIPRGKRKRVKITSDSDDDDVDTESEKEEEKNDVDTESEKEEKNEDEMNHMTQKKPTVVKAGKVSRKKVDINDPDAIEGKRKNNTHHTEEWINKTVAQYSTVLERIEDNGKTVLRCIPCHAFYTHKGEKRKQKKFHWADGIEDCRTWERYKEHIVTDTHISARARMVRTSEEKNSLIKALEEAAKKNASKYDNKNIEEKLQCVNVVRNLYSTIKQKQSTRSLYSRLGCFDFYLTDVFNAVEQKVNLATSLYQSQPTEYRKEELDKFKNLQEAMPTLLKLTGASQSERYKNRAVKMRNIKLEIGESIYTSILSRVQSGQIHTFSSDGVEDIRVRHALNIFFQSKTQKPGHCLNYFGRIEYAKWAMDAEGETRLLCHLINHCLGEFPGYVFGGVLDGPNVHFGESNSVSTLMKISFTRDFSHCSALAVTHETKAIPEIRQVKETLEDIGRDLKNSYQKQIEYRGTFDSLEEECLEIELCPSTRWVYIRSAGMKLIKVLLPIITFYENRAERHLDGNTEDPSAMGRLKVLKDPKFVTVLFTTMDILEPVIALNTRTQGRNRLICEKRHDVALVLSKLEALNVAGGPFEKQLLSLIDFSEDYPKLIFEKGEIQLRKLPGHITRATRSTNDEVDISSRRKLMTFIGDFKRRATTRLQEEIQQCMSKDSLANHFGVFDILHMPIVTEREEGWYQNDYGEEDIKEIAEYFGNEFWVLKSFKDCSSPNGRCVKPVLEDPVIDKDALPVEFAAARGDIVRTYRAAVKKGDKLSNMFASDAQEDDDEGEDDNTVEHFTQKAAYEDFVDLHQEEFPNLCTVVRHLLAHIPNSVDPERNASNLKATLTKQRNRLEYDTLNSEMQVTENGPKLFTDETELLLSNVADSVLSGGFRASNFKSNLTYMKNVM